jgi:hypothetical protein
VPQLYTHFQTPYLDLSTYTFDSETVKIIPEEMARSLFVVALDVLGDILIVSCANPYNKSFVGILETKLNKKVMLVYSTSNEIINAINNNY